jgi:hypothetical protein
MLIYAYRYPCDDFTRRDEGTGMRFYGTTTDLYTYSRYRNGLEYTALSELRRVPLTRATNADFAHRYELYIINWEVEDSLTLVLYWGSTEQLMHWHHLYRLCTPLYYEICGASVKGNCLRLGYH